MLLKTFNEFLHSSEQFFSENGIWYARTTGNVSFPEEAYSTIFEIEDGSFWFRHRKNCIISLAKKQLGNDLFFDIGGGSGVITKALEDEGFGSVLVEPSSTIVAHAKQRNIANVVCCSLHDLAPLKGKFAAIGAFDVIEHIEEDSAFIHTVSEFLRKDGLFYITVPAYQFLWSDDDSFGGHYRRYRLKNIKKLLERNHFKIVYSTYLFSVLLPPVFIYRTLGTRLGLHKANVNIYKEHHQPTGITSKLLDVVWRWELSMVQKMRYIPFGTSCFIIGKK